MDLNDLSIFCFYKRQPAGYAFQTRDYDHFQWIVVTSGSVILRVRKQDIKVTPGRMLVLRKGSGFALRCEGQGYRGMAVGIEGRLSEMYCGDSFLVDAGPELLRLAGVLERELSAANPGAEEVLAPLGLAVCNMAIRTGAGEPVTGMAASSPTDWAQRVRQCLDAQLYTGTPMHEVLAGMGLSYRQLVRHFSSTYGITPKQYQLQHRIEEARRLLSRTRLSVTTIAHELGFPSSQYFAVQFKELVGSQPSTYRVAALRQPEEQGS
jgi:AraC-like DNA-binding protein